MAFNTTIRIQNQSSSVYHSRKREPPVAVYVPQMIRSKIHNLSMIINISRLVICISKERFVQLSVGMGKTVIDMNEKEGVVFPTNLRESLFSTATVNNIDVATKSNRFMEQLRQLINICHLKTRVSSQFFQELCQLTLNWSIYQNGTQKYHQLIDHLSPFRNPNKQIWKLRYLYQNCLRIRIGRMTKYYTLDSVPRLKMYAYNKATRYICHVTHLEERFKVTSRN